MMILMNISIISINQQVEEEISEFLWVNNNTEISRRWGHVRIQAKAYAAVLEGDDAYPYYVDNGTYQLVDRV